MSGDSPTHGLTRTEGNSARERAIGGFFLACALLSVLTTVAIIVLLVGEASRFFRVTATLLGAPAAETVTLKEFFFGGDWAPGFEPRSFGVLPLVVGTIMITIGSAVIALPLGVATAIYLSEYASSRARGVLKPALEILAGVPTVIYGYFALVYITPALEVVFPSIGTFNALSGSIVVGIMIIPMVSSISEDAMSAVPDELREAGYGMGATKFDVSTGVVVPAAISGILSSFILALSRAIGETMAVTLAAGSTPKMLNPLDPTAYLESIMTMTAAMVNVATGDMVVGGPAYQSLFAVGLTLFVITLAMNVLSDLVAARYREEYE